MLQQAKLASFASNSDYNKSENFYKEFSYRVTKGMGQTLGNSLRRTLLSQISGYAIRYVVINGVNHEFSSIPGMKESVQELLMNLRQVVFKGDVKSATVDLNVTKIGEVFASDINFSSLEVINPDLYLCTLSEDTSLGVEIYLEKGVGIILSREVDASEYQLDAIICDAFFNPIKKVNFVIENIENNAVEEMLTLSLHTNGSINPDEAMDVAIELWRQEMAKISEKMILPLQAETSNKKLRVLSDALYYKITDVQGMTTRILNCIKSLNIKYVGELVKFSQKDLLEKPNFGENSLNQLNEILGNIGLSLGMDITGWEEPIEETTEETFIR